MLVIVPAMLCVACAFRFIEEFDRLLLVVGFSRSSRLWLSSGVVGCLGRRFCG